MISPKIRWGIVGTGYAKEFAKALAAFRHSRGHLPVTRLKVLEK